MEYLDILKNYPHLSPQKVSCPCPNVYVLCFENMNDFSQVFDLRSTQKYHRFVPYWNNNVIHGIGGFLLNLVRIHTTFKEDELTEVLGRSVSRDSMFEAQEGGDTPVFRHTYHISKSTAHNWPIGTFLAHPAIKDIIEK